MSLKSKMTALADEVRDLSGTTDSKSIESMTSDINDINNEITTQEELIAQLQAAVDSLPEAGGGSGEDVTAEVSEYTNKIASLESAVASLETELANKASGGSSGGGTESTETCTIQITTRNSFNTIFYKSIKGWKIEEVTQSTTISPICDSIVMVQQAGFYEAEISAGIILVEHSGTGFVYQVPNTPNETITINIIID